MEQTSVTRTRQIGKLAKHAAQRLFREYSILFVFLLVCAVIASIRPVFLSVNNIFNVVRQVSMIGIMSVGMTFVILSADIDLSVGSVAGFCGALAAGLMARQGLSPLAAILIPLPIAALMGWTIGIIVTKAKVHSFVVTLGMMSIARGLALVYTKGLSIGNLPKSFGALGGGMVGPIPVPVIVFVVFMILGYLVLTRTPYGRAVYAIGGNQEAARLSGIKVARYRITNFILCSTLAGFAGIILASRTRSAWPAAATGWELDVISAVVIGGTSFFGGRGGMIGTLIGALFLGVLRNGANLIGVSPFYQQILIGTLVVAAVVIDRLRQSKTA
ncbi:ABC transporter permease [Candidatus Bipolaricaulota bacterium]|nr:ABC transporter permease [Candidatus Bipolaricaulota bacterium]